MAITFPLTPPSSPTHRSIKFTQLSAGAKHVSPFNFTEQVYVHKGQAWQAEVTLPKMLRAEAEAWIAFLLSLNGLEGTFYLRDESSKTARGVATGTPVINSGGTVDQLKIGGFTASVTGILKAGDWIGCENQLYKVLQDANSNVSGVADVYVWPDARTYPATSAAVTVSSAKGVFRLAAPISWDIDHMKVYGLSFSAVEAI